VPLEVEEVVVVVETAAVVLVVVLRLPIGEIEASEFRALLPRLARGVVVAAVMARPPLRGVLVRGRPKHGDGEEKVEEEEEEEEEEARGDDGWPLLPLLIIHGAGCVS
jgi:hypothetical protein